MIHKIPAYLQLAVAIVILAPLLAAGLGCDGRGSDGVDPVRVFAASSTTLPLEELARRFEAEGGTPVKLSLASSSRLAQQIRQGAPATLFLSASPVWMDRLEEESFLEPGTRRDLLANDLVLIAPRGEEITVRPESSFDLAAAFEGHFAIADPAHVPLGIYGKQAMESLGWWDPLSGRIFTAVDARATVLRVARGECPLGIAYASDAHGVDEVVSVASIPKRTHAPIRYPIAVVKGADREAAQRFLDYLSTESARAVFEGYGFRHAEEAARRCHDCRQRHRDRRRSSRQGRRYLVRRHHPRR